MVSAAATADAELDALFAALASGPRRAIVAHLTTGPATTPELGRRFDFSKQALNRHIVALEGTGLIERRLDGRVHTIALVPERLDGVTHWTDHIRAAWSGNLDRLGAVLDEMDMEDEQ